MGWLQNQKLMQRLHLSLTMKMDTEASVASVRLWLRLKLKLMPRLMPRLMLMLRLMLRLSTVDTELILEDMEASVASVRLRLRLMLKLMPRLMPRLILLLRLMLMLRLMLRLSTVDTELILEDMEASVGSVRLRL